MTLLKHGLPLLTLLALVPTAPVSPAFAQPSKENFHLVWSDEFDGSGLPDSKNWGYEEGCSVRNSELQYYTKARIENAHIENGMLTIEARKEKMGSCNYTSANLITNGKRSIKYGLFELRAKIDIRAGSWPAWWWLPTSGGWPKGGEIDMMEFYKGKTLFNVMDGNQKWYSKTKAVDAAWAEAFHVWTWEWDSLKIDLWLDNTLMNHYSVADANGTGPNGENPFRRPGYMLVNQAIGGSNGGDPAGTTFPVRFMVDYIRHYMPGKDTGATGKNAFDGTMPQRRNGGAILQPPLSVKVYSVDGKLVDRWSVGTHDAPVSLSALLNRACRGSTNTTRGIHIVAINDTSGHSVGFQTLVR